MSIQKQIEKILFVSLSNIGDAILTLPALDRLREEFPQAKVTVVCGERPKELFLDNPYIEQVIVYNRRVKFREKLKLLDALKKEKFGLIADLRNSYFGALLPAGRKTSVFLNIPESVKHAKSRHLYKIKDLVSGIKGAGKEKKSLYISPSDERFIEEVLREGGVSSGKDKLVIVASGARSHIKRWSKEKFAQLAAAIAKEYGVKIILTGDKDDLPVNGYIAGHLGNSALDLTGRISLSQLAYLLQKASLLVTNDSAVLHMAGYLNVPTVALFGPTSDEKYGVWSEDAAVVKKEIFCRPCEKAQCRFGTLECMQLIRVEDALGRVRNILSGKSLQAQNPEYKRILIVRTDRIGDVLLSTPVISALRHAYPNAYIAMMVSPYAKEIVEGNPYLDQAIIYDKDGKHKSLWRTIKFARNLKKKRFDLAIVLHPTNRAHLVTFLAAIRRRIGYDRKLGFLLTDRIKHEKQYGRKHEAEYNLDLVKYLGIAAEDTRLFMPVKAEYEQWADELFKKEGIAASDQLLAIHPGASCPSKIYPQERFAQAADRLAQKYGFKILLVAGPKDIALTQSTQENMRSSSLDLGGRTSVGQLAAILKRCRLFISNDSGPVHIAAAVGVPVISIFGRSQKGLGPLRWGPLGEKGRVLHKDVGCIECLAHNCVKEFACLKAISVDDVVASADELLREK